MYTYFYIYIYDKYSGKAEAGIHNNNNQAARSAAVETYIPGMTEAGVSNASSPAFVHASEYWLVSSSRSACNAQSC